MISKGVHFLHRCMHSYPFLNINTSIKCYICVQGNLAITMNSYQVSLSCWWAANFVFSLHGITTIFATLKVRTFFRENLTITNDIKYSANHNYHLPSGAGRYDNFKQRQYATSSLWQYILHIILKYNSKCSGLIRRNRHRSLFQIMSQFIDFIMFWALNKRGEPFNINFLPNFALLPNSLPNLSAEYNKINYKMFKGLY